MRLVSATVHIADLCDIGMSPDAGREFLKKHQKRIRASMLAAGVACVREISNEHKKTPLVECKLTKFVTRDTRAGKNGKAIQCPECGDIHRVGHFAWYASKCDACGAWIKKTDYILAEQNKAETR